jgi:general secretion pathway protein L
LPVATQSHLPEIIRHEIEKRSGFSADDTYYAFKVTPSNSISETLRVLLVVVPRVTVDKAKAQLEQRGIQIKRVTAPYPSPLSEQAVLWEAPRRGQHRHAVWKLAAASILAFACGMGATAGVLKLNALKAEAMDLEARVGAIRSEIANGNILLDRTATITAQLSAVYHERSERPPTITVVDELSRLLPDGTWLQQLSIKDKTVTLVGQTPSTVDLIRILSASTLVHDPQLLNRVTTDRSSGLEQFTIIAALGPDESGAP